MKYVKVAWGHDVADDLCSISANLAMTDINPGKVQFYRDGRPEWADESFETATCGLSEISFPLLEEISSQAEFTAQVITPEAFERAWNETHGIA